jgi:hypothetical protein
MTTFTVGTMTLGTTPSLKEFPGRSSSVSTCQRSKVASFAILKVPIFSIDRTIGLRKMLAPWAILVFHDAAVELQQEDVDFGRYHPLILNAAHLGGLHEEERRILGFGGSQLLEPPHHRKNFAANRVAGATRTLLKAQRAMARLDSLLERVLQNGTSLTLKLRQKRGSVLD